MADRSVKVRLEAVVNPYVTKMAEAEAATRKMSQAQKDMKKATEDLGRNIQKVGVGLTLGLTAPFLAITKHAVDTAMTAQETANRVSVAFGDMEASVHQWSENSARTMGLARHEAEGTAATFDTMFTEMGLGRAAAYNLSTGIVKLAADVGSFRDVDPTQMLEKMRAGVVGEYEPLRQLGIVLTDAQVRQEAVRQGLAEGTAEVSTAALVQARYSLILQQTSKDQGDYARTADSATNSTRTARAAYEDAMAQLGEKLLPLIAKGAQTVTALAEAFTSLPGPVQTVILGLGGLLATAGPLLIAFGSIIRNLDEISKRAGVLGTIGKAGAATVGVLAYAEAVRMLSGEIKNLLDERPRIDETTVALVNLAEGVGTWQQVTDAASETQKRIKEIIQAVNEGQVTKQKSGLGRQLDDIDKALAAMVDRGAPQLAAKALKDVAAAIGVKPTDLVPYLDDYAGALNGSAAAAALAGAATEEMGGDAGDAAVAVDELRKKLDELYDSAFGAQEASDKFTTDLMDFIDGVRTAKIEGDAWASSLDASNTTGLRNRDTLRGLVGDLFDYASSTGASAEQLAVMRGQLVEALTQLGFNRTEAEKFTAVLTQLDGQNVKPKIGLDVSEADAKLTWMERRMRGLGIGGPWHGGSSSGPQVETDPFGFPVVTTPPGLAGGGPDETAALERKQHEREEASRNYLDALKRAEEERKRLEEQTTQFLDAIYKHRQELEDNQYEVEAMSKDRYLEILRDRLKGLEQYSNEWTAVYRKIQEIEGDALEAQLKLIEQFEAGRDWQFSYDMLAGQRLLPAQGASSTTIYNTSTAWNPTFVANGSDATQATATNSQKLRDFATLMG